MINYNNPNNTDHTTQKNIYIKEMELLRSLWIDENSMTLNQRQNLIDIVETYWVEREQPLEKTYGDLMQDLRAYAHNYNLADAECEQDKALYNIIEKNRI